MNEEDMVTGPSMVGIDVLLVVDTATIRKYYDVTMKTKPSTDSANPTWLPTTLQTQFLFCNSPRGVSNQGTHELSFTANAFDLVSFAGTSIEANSDSAVIVYGLKKRSDKNVFNAFTQNWVEREKAVMPAQGTGLPPLLKPATFATYSATVSGSGEESFDLYFAQYYLADDGQTQKLYGYFVWDPKITVTKPNAT
ncbi:MAG: nematocidal protein AidA [Acidobacteriota bacterium]|jgi:hypothetical protein|nr:nematocidal protein AidA [Acidobacteriota bacterium]